MRHCERCSGLMLLKYGISNNDRTGEEYEYWGCVICGNVKHKLSEDEQKEQFPILFDTHVKQEPTIKLGNLPVSLGPNECNIAE